MGIGPEKEWEKDKARLIAGALKEMGVEAVNIGRNDLALGIGIVTQTAVGERVPWVSANVRPAAGKPAYPPYRIVRWGEREVSVFGLAPPSPRTDGELGVIVEDPVVAARRTMSELAGTDLVICLSGLGLSADKALAEAVPGIGIIIGAREGQRLMDPPQRVGDTLILRNADRGRQLGVLELDAEVLGSKWKAPHPEGAEEPIRGQINRLSALLASPRGGKTPDPAERSRLERTLASLRGTLAEMERSPVRVRHRLIPLSSEVPDDPALRGSVNEVLARRPKPRPRVVPATGRSPFEPPSAPLDRLEIPASAGRVVAPPPEPPTGDPVHVGTLSCRRCHRGEYQAWFTTPHARSLSSLPSERRLDSLCRSCHALRLDLGDGIREEAMVGCEACHGKGSHHTGPGNILRAVPESTCRNCHRGHHPEETFDYRRDYRRIRCDEIKKQK